MTASLDRVSRSAETLAATETFEARRRGRFIVVDLLVPHRVLSTSEHRGGQREAIRHLVNHQSCEGRSHAERERFIRELGLAGYHRRVCEELGTDPDRTALMGTAANMAYACHRQASHAELRADAFVTAGVSGNAARAGDPASWHEGDGGWHRVAPHAGTINAILLLNWPVTAAAHARAIVTMTEAKSAALAELAVPSKYSRHIATGTGTDQFCIAAPLAGRGSPKSSTGPHSKLGEIIGTCVKEAVAEALRWQNGLEPSYTRSLFHALGRFGLTEAGMLERLSKLLPERQMDLLAANKESVFHEPGAAAAAFAVAAVLDRAAYGTLPGGVAKETLRQQCACLASALAARPDSWVEFYRSISVRHEDPMDMVLEAIALGWNAKWT